MSFAKKLVFGRFSNEIVSIRKTINLSLPDRLKGTFVEKWGNFWKNLLNDYAEVFKDAAKDIKEKPKRALAYTWGFAVWWMCVQTNPNSLSFRDQVLSSSLELSSIPDSIRNSDSAAHLVFLESCYNTGIIRHLNLGIFSCMWMDNFDKSLGIYPAQCKYLEPKYLTFYDRIVDVGFLGRWWIINQKMVDCDVNNKEWRN